MKITLRPMPTWPHGQETRDRRDAQFKSTGGRRIGYDQTIHELEYEVDRLGGTDIVIGVGLTEYDVKTDGSPRANARPMLHPGVEISFNSKHGRLTYATDVYTDWRDNVRAIVKGLEALRGLDRWGVARRGEQYAGFAMLTAGPGLEELGKQMVEKYGSVNAALKATHPDTGNNEDAGERNLQAVVVYRDAHASA